MSEEGTSSGTVAVINDYSDKRIRHIRGIAKRAKMNRQSNLLNVGLKEARGEYIALMDADDVSIPTRLDKEMQFLDRHPQIGVVGTGWEIIDEKDRVIGKHRHPAAPALIKWELLFNDAILNPSAMVRRAIYHELGGYDLEYLHAGDYELWSRAAQITYLANLPDLLLKYRHHKGNVSRVHRRIQVQMAIKASQKALAAALGQDIRLAVATALAEPDYIARPRDALDAAVTLCDLYLRYMSRECLSKTEQKLIRANTVRRLLSLASRCFSKNPVFSAKIFGLVVRLCREQLFSFLVLITPTAASYVWKRIFQRQL